MKVEESVKYNNLLSYLGSFERVAVAFSGGVDSAFLLHVAAKASRNPVLALTGRTVYIPDWEIRDAIEFAAKTKNVNHKIIDIPFMQRLRESPKDRCYQCKSLIFNRFIQEASKEKYEVIMDGTNYDDLSDYRPGLQALKELQVCSPLMDHRFTKEDIRKFSEQLGLPTWDKPAYACLLTRIPYGQEVTNSELKRIDEGEEFLKGLGFDGVRIRLHDKIARIEIPRDTMPAVLDMNTIDKIQSGLKKLGFKYVTLDLEGYRTGSLNESL